MDFKEIQKNLTIHNAKDFITTLPQNVPVEWLKGVDTNFHFDIEGDGGGQFSVIVRNEKMEVFEYFEGTPKCKITAKEKNFISLLRGELNPMMAIFTGKLKISDTGEIIKYARLFGIM